MSFRRPAALRFRPSCHRCGAPLADPACSLCTHCFEPPRVQFPGLPSRLIRMRLRIVLLLIAGIGVALGWGVSAWRHRLADDSHEIYSHEEMAEYQAFLEAVANRHAREAEQKAASGGVDATRWAREAAEAREKASAHAEQKREYRWRAKLKRDGW